LLVPTLGMPQLTRIVVIPTTAKHELDGHKHHHKCG
jgi:hypothetical protein